jgi:hypothetical protein
MSGMVHLVLTRFNVRANASQRGKALDEAWLKDRFDLFERFCWPSMRNQTEQNFKWLVFFDIETPDVARQRIAEYAKWSNFVPMFLNPGLDSSAKSVVARYLDELPDTLVTTRLDNDDGIAVDYVAHVQKYANAVEPTVIEFPCGYIWHKDRLYLDHQPHNAFTSLIEPLKARNTKSFTTIYHGSHTEVEQLGKVVCVSDEPTWLQVVHGGNLENRPRGVRCAMREMGARFAVAHQGLAANEGALDLAIDRVVSASYMGITNGLRYVKRSLKGISAKSSA